MGSGRTPVGGSRVGSTILPRMWGWQLRNEIGEACSLTRQTCRTKPARLSGLHNCEIRKGWRVQNRKFWRILTRWSPQWAPGYRRVDLRRPPDDRPDDTPENPIEFRDGDPAVGWPISQTRSTSGSKRVTCLRGVAGQPNTEDKRLQTCDLLVRWSICLVGPAPTRAGRAPVSRRLRRATPPVTGQWHRPGGATEDGATKRAQPIPSHGQHKGPRPSAGRVSGRVTFDRAKRRGVLWPGSPLGSLGHAKPWASTRQRKGRICGDDCLVVRKPI